MQFLHTHTHTHFLKVFICVRKTKVIHQNNINDTNARLVKKRNKTARKQNLKTGGWDGQG